MLRREGKVDVTFAPTDPGADPATESRLDGLWTASQANPTIDVARATPALRSMGVDVAIAIHFTAGYNTPGRAAVHVLDARTGQVGSATLHLGSSSMIAGVREAYGKVRR